LIQTNPKDPDDFYNTEAQGWWAYHLYTGVEPLPKLTTTKAVFFDCEATGLDPEEARIVDLCLYIRHEGREEWKDRLINPEGPIPPDSTRVHGITDEMVRDCLPFRTVAKSLATLLEGAAVIAHNARGYDVPLLRAEFRRAGITWEPAQVIDTLPLSRQRFRGRRSYALQNLARDFGFRERAKHRARPDVETLLDLWSLLLTQDMEQPARRAA
jgi:DNA polymerase III epsilon subunit-like protein